MSLKLSNNSFLAPFTVVLVAVPATVGGVLAATLSRTG